VLRWRRAAVAACLVCALGGVLGASLRVQARGSGPLPRWASAHSSAIIEAVLSDDPRQVVSRKGTPLTLLTVTSQSVTVKGARLRQRVPLLVLAQGGGWLGLLPSTRVTFSARLAAARPGDEVAALAFPEHRAPRVRAGPSLLQRAAGRLRWGLREASTGLPVGADGLLPGLVVGDTAGLRPSDKADFRATGLTHLIAVSGTNCTAVLTAALALARLAGLRRRPAALVAGLVLLAFVIVARPSPSVLRAAVMGWVALLAWVHGRRRTATGTLAGAVLVLLLLDPGLAHSAGFALSVLACGGLLLIAPGWRDALVARGWNPALADAVAIPAAAQVACMPVLAGLGAGVSLVAIPANLLAAPAVASATLAGVLAAVLSPLLPGLAHAAAWLAAVPCAWLLVVARVGAALPGATVGWPSGVTGALTAGLMAPLLLAVLRKATLCGGVRGSPKPIMRRSTRAHHRSRARHPGDRRRGAPV
jgi:competence protein ComEC